MGIQSWSNWLTSIAFVRVPYGRAPSRNFVATYYPPGTPVVAMDDDIDAVLTRVDKKTLVPLPDLDKFFRDAFAMAQANGCRLWGLYPLLNAFYMQPTVTFDLRPIAGGLFGYTSPDVLVTHGCKEDMERTLLYYEQDRRVMRCNHVGVKTLFYAGAGGMRQERTVKAEQAAVDYLIKRFPGWAHAHWLRRSPFPEIALQDRRKGRKSV
jgi:hypothetical protein